MLDLTEGRSCGPSFIQPPGNRRHPAPPSPVEVQCMSNSTAPAIHDVDLILDAVNAMFTRLRHTQTEPPVPPPVAASHAAVDYIEAFWPHVATLIAADPAGLGMSFENEGQRRDLESARRDPELRARAGNDLFALSILAPMRVMNELLNTATAAWAKQLRAQGMGCPLRYSVDAEQFVSLRTLLPHREDDQTPVGANAPTLVMGGTTTAITLCWNLLWRLPGAYRELTGKHVDRATMDELWIATRELLFRIGGGSLLAFVSFASACTSRIDAQLWEGMGDLHLAHVDGRFVWTMNEAFFQRMLEMVNRIHLAQQGHYVGCAALYARAAPLTLGGELSDLGDGAREPTIFSELVRWISVVARAEYFPVFATRR